MNTVNTFASKAYQSLPSLSLPRLRLDTPSNMVKKATLLAIPVILLLGSEHAAQGADGGPVSFVACMAACSAAVFFNPFLLPSLPACQMACEILGAAPIP